MKQREQSEQSGKIYELTFQKSSEGVSARNDAEQFCTHKQHHIKYKQYTD